MDQRFSIFQMIAGIAYTEEIGSELGAQKTPFTKFDVLTPEESGRVGQLTKRLLSVSHNILISLLFLK
jgi:hypothetical protein